MKRIVGLVCLAWPFLAFSQGSTGINNTNPSSKAALDVKAYGKQGLLIPRLAAADTGLIVPGAGQNKGLTFYDSVSTKFWYWTGTKWLGYGGSASAAAWNLTGNTASSTDFLGTTNTQPIVIKASNKEAIRATVTGNTMTMDFGDNDLLVNGYIFNRNTGAQVNINSMVGLVAVSDPGYGSAASFSLRNNAGQVLFGLTHDGNFAISQGANIGLSSDDFKVFPNGNVGIGNTIGPAPLSVFATGSNWDLSTTEGDFNIGNGTYRFKIGVATGGGGAGDVYIGAQGGTNRIFIGAGTTGTDFQTLTVAAGSVGIGTTAPTTALHVSGTGTFTDEINRTETVDANMVPIAYGTISSAGAIYAGSTSNFTVAKQGTGWYKIDITGHSYYYQSYVTICSAYGSALTFINYYDAGTSLYIRTYNSAGTAVDAFFNFVVYKK